MDRVALVMTFAAVLATAACEQQKPPMTPDGPESALGDAGDMPVDPTPVPSAPAPGK